MAREIIDIEELDQWQLQGDTESVITYLQGIEQRHGTGTIIDSRYVYNCTEREIWLQRYENDEEFAVRMEAKAAKAKAEAERIEESRKQRELRKVLKDQEEYQEYLRLQAKYEIKGK